MSMQHPNEPTGSATTRPAPSPWVEDSGTLRDRPYPPPGDRTEVVTERSSTAYSGLRDRLRWGPVVGGLFVTVGTYLVLQLALVTSRLVDLPASGTRAGWWSAAAAIVAFVLGGVTAGATASWSEPSDGVLHGIVMWATAVVTLVVLAAVGGGVALGSLNTTDVFHRITADASTTVDAATVRDTAGWALIGLAVALAAAAVGGAIGARTWPRRTVERDRVRRA